MPNSLRCPDLVAVAQRVAFEHEALVASLRQVSDLHTRSWRFPFTATGSDRKEFADKLQVMLGDICCGIYIIQFSGVESKEILCAYESRPQGNAYSRVNPLTETSAIYVGRGNNLRSRICQHLIRGPAATHALHMGTWASDLPGLISLCVTDCAGFSDDVVQAMEDGLWEERRPLFGRKGRR